VTEVTDFEILWAIPLMLLGGCVASGFIAWWHVRYATGSFPTYIRADYGAFALTLPGMLAVLSMVWPWGIVDRGTIMSLTIAILITVAGVVLNSVGVICGIHIAKRRSKVN